jgi:hypothetical protein
MIVHANIINESIQSELNKGRIKELMKLPTQYFCSPIGLVPKKIDSLQTGWRIISDLSYPESESVNDGIPKEFGAIIYESLNTAIRLVAQADKEVIMLKRDLKSAFRHIPVNPHDYWLLIFEWEGSFM